MDTHSQPSSKIELLTPVQFLKGVGPQRAELLAKLGLYYARDLVFYFPRAYQDMSELRSIETLEEGLPATVTGVIEEVRQKATSSGRTILGVLIRQETRYLRALWFNQPYMRTKMVQGRRVLLSGVPKMNGLRWEMAHPKVEFLAEDEDVPQGRLLPVYGLTEGIAQTAMRRIVHSAVESCLSLIEDVFPSEYLDEKKLWPIVAAIGQTHSPTGKDALAEAQRRLVYQELLVLQLAISRRRTAHEERKALAFTATTKVDSRIRRLFPFDFTRGQNQAIAEISADMARQRPMNRLLQGDVGAGKTVVAQYAMLLAMAHGAQTVLMAPTEILASQHFESFSRALAQSRVRMGLFTGALDAAQRKSLLEQTAAGEIDLLIGTHAIATNVQSGVLQFKNLGLVVIDEQHRFGVEQRKALKQSESDPHYLVMTATPIPRTVALTMFGDLDVSILRDMPADRAEVRTYWVTADKVDRWWAFVRKKIREGNQGFVVVTRVESEEDDEDDLPFSLESPDPSARPNKIIGIDQIAEELGKGVAKGLRIGVIHGRQRPETRRQVMEDFRAKKIQLLIATSVIEVGIDIPNATLMTILDAERFGLSQLHQLRGRVGRGKQPGFVGVFANPQSDESSDRIRAFVKTNDGFKLAEIDFELRGPGEFFGAKQHGLPPFRIADLQRDQAAIEQTRRDARELIEDKSRWESEPFAKLRRMVQVRYGEALELGDVG